MRGSLISEAYLKYLIKNKTNSFKLINVINTNYPLRETKEQEQLNNQCLIHKSQELLNLYDLCSSYVPVPYKIPTKLQFESYIKFRFDKQTPIILFDETIHLACRAWFILRYYGFNNIYILDGGYHHWRTSQQSMQDNFVHLKFEQNPPTQFKVTSTPDVQMISYLKSHNDPKAITAEIIDARDKTRFRDANVPGSINIEYTEYLNINKTLKSDAELRNVYKDHKIDLNKRIINMCQTGKVSTIALLVQEMLGKRDLVLYDGSYTDYEISQS